METKKISRTTIHKIILWAMVFAMLAVDHLTKWLTTTNLARGQSHPFIQDVLHFTYVRNYGAAHGMFRDSRWVFLSLSSVAIVVLVIMLVFFYDRFSTLANFGAASILAGGVGNMIDRTFFGEYLFGGGVIDMIDVRAFGGIWGPVFNFADIFITLGVVVFMFAFIRDEIRLAKGNKAKSFADTESSELPPTCEKPPQATPLASEEGMAEPNHDHDTQN